MNKCLLPLFYLRQRRKRKQRYRKKYWIRDIFRSRFLLGEYHTLVKEMHENDHESFYKYFRMTPERFDNLLLLVGPMLTKKSLYREPISAGERLSVTLRFLATGDSQQTISFSYRIGLTTVSNIIAETCDALWIALQDYITSPSKPEEWKQIADDFWNVWNFPMCCGAIDGKHLVMQCPPGAGSDYFNYKGTFIYILIYLYTYCTFAPFTNENMYVYSNCSLIGEGGGRFTSGLNTF